MVLYTNWLYEPFFFYAEFNHAFVDNLLTRYANNKNSIFYKKSLEYEKKVVSLHFELSTKG